MESGILDNVKSLLDMSLSDDAVFASMEVFNAAFVAEKISTAEKEEIRQKVLKQYTGLLSTERYSEGRRRARVELAIQYLEGPYATGTLVGNKAPELDFLWMSSRGREKFGRFEGKSGDTRFLGDKVWSMYRDYAEHESLDEEVCGVSRGNYRSDFRHGLPRGREEWKDNPDERKFGI